MLEDRLPKKMLLAAGVCLFLYLAAGAGASTGSLSLHATKRDVLYGQSTVLTGRLSNKQGKPVANAPVALTTRPYPYKHRVTTHAAAFTNNRGHFKIKVKPEYNTRYFARSHYPPAPSPYRETTTVRSRNLLVAVYPVPHFNLRTRNKYALAHYQLKFSPFLPTRIDHRPVTWYFHKDGTKLWRAVDHTRTRETRPGVIRTGLQYKLPASRHPYSYHVNVCIDFPLRHDVGFGRPKAHPTACPRHGYTA